MTPQQSARWDQRLYNWALYQIGGEGGASITSAYGLVASGGRRSIDVVPTLVGEATDTEHLVRMLDEDQQSAVVAWYVWTGSVADRARDMGCHPNTLRSRVESAKARLLAFESVVRRAMDKPASC